MVIQSMVGHSFAPRAVGVATLAGRRRPASPPSDRSPTLAVGARQSATTHGAFGSGLAHRKWTQSGYSSPFPAESRQKALVPAEPDRYRSFIISDKRVNCTQVVEPGAALMRCLRIVDALNTITLRGKIETGLPVLGLRPILWRFLRTTKEPKDDSFTDSPRSRQSVISLSTNSTSV